MPEKHTPTGVGGAVDLLDFLIGLQDGDLVNEVFFYMEIGRERGQKRGPKKRAALSSGWT